MDRLVTSALVVTTTSPLGTRHTELLVREDTDILKGVQRLQLDEILPGEFMVAPVETGRSYGGRSGLISSFFPNGMIITQERCRRSPFPWLAIDRSIRRSSGNGRSVRTIRTHDWEKLDRPMPVHQCPLPPVLYCAEDHGQRNRLFTNMRCRLNGNDVHLTIKN